MSTAFDLTDTDTGDLQLEDSVDEGLLVFISDSDAVVRGGAPTLDLVEPQEWESCDLVFEGDPAPDMRSISKSAAELRAMSDEEYLAYFKDLTGFDHKGGLF